MLANYASFTSMTWWIDEIVGGGHEENRKKIIELALIPIVGSGAPSQKTSLLGGVAQILINPRPSSRLADVGLFVRLKSQQIVSFTMGLSLRPLGETIPPAVAKNLPLEVVPSPVIDCFFGAMARWRGFFEDRFCKGEL